MVKMHFFNFDDIHLYIYIYLLKCISLILRTFIYIFIYIYICIFLRKKTYLTAQKDPIKVKLNTFASVTQI